MSDITIYGSPLHPFTWSVKMALEEKETKYAIYPYKAGSDEMLREHPLGKVPAIREADIHLFDPIGMLVYIDEEHGSPPLQPRDNIEKADMFNWMGFFASEVFPVLGDGIAIPRVIARVSGESADTSGVETAAGRAGPILQAFDDLMRDRRWMVGGQMSLADILAAPVFFYFKMSPEGQKLLPNFQHVGAWYTNMTDVPTFRETKPDLPKRE